MAKITLKGFDKYEKMLASHSKEVDGMIKRAVYDGAGVVLESIESAIQALPTHRFVYVYGGQYIRYLTPEQKQGLLDGLGAAKMRNDNGYINTKIGFDGYNSVVTDMYPKGQPNSLIARSIESGTSLRPKTRFVATAVKSVSKQAEQAMEDSCDNYLKKLLGG